MSEAVASWKLLNTSIICQGAGLLILHFLIFVSLILLAERMDGKFDKCVRDAFDLSDASRPAKDVRIKEELMLLMQELSNRDDCQWSSISRYPLTTDLILSFANYVIAFCVMVITVRIQIRGA